MHHFLSWVFVYRKWVCAEELRGRSTAAGLASALGDKMQDPDADTECNDILTPSKESLNHLEKEAEEQQRVLQQSIVKT